MTIAILPSTTKTIQTNSVPLLWNPDVNSQSSRIDANFARAAITSGSSAGPVLTAYGWENKLQGCQDFVTNRAGATHTPAGAIGDPSSYSALWYGTPLSALPTGGIPGFPVVDPAGPATLLGPSYFLPISPGVDSMSNLVYGNAFTSGDPDEYLGSTPTPFPYPAIGL